MDEMIKDLIKEMSACSLFIGKYDAEHGDNSFMYGIYAVMEYLAYKVSEEYGDNFSNMFMKNMIDSKDKI